MKIIGLHEGNRILFHTSTGFFAVLDREAKRIVAGPFKTSDEANVENQRLRSNGMRHAAVSYYSGNLR